MSFGEAIKSVFGQYATFSGRARRSEYWYWFLFYVLVYSVLYGLGTSMDSQLLTGLAGIFSLAVLIPNLAVGVRRMHDIGKSGWAILISLVPLVGGIILLVWDCKDSQPGDNLYGPNPKGQL